VRKALIEIAAQYGKATGTELSADFGPSGLLQRLP
jgi:hypothetical protein